MIAPSWDTLTPISAGVANEVWGTVPAWVSTISVIIAAFAIWRSARDKKREQASKVSAWIDSEIEAGRAFIRIRNNSDAPVYQVTIVGPNSRYLYSVAELDPGGRGDVSLKEYESFKDFFTYMKAEREAERKQTTIENEYEKLKSDKLEWPDWSREPAIQLHFRDALGRWWLRNKSGWIRPSRKRSWD